VFLKQKRLPIVGDQQRWVRDAIHLDQEDRVRSGEQDASVWFVSSGKRYDFDEVPPETYVAFRSAFAKGRFFNDHIRDHFRYRRNPE
jgi:hypothetical protein